MKKLISILLIVVLIVSCMTFVGCEADVSLDEEIFANVCVIYRDIDKNIEKYENHTVSSKETLFLSYHTCKYISVYSYGYFYIKDGKKIDLTSKRRTDAFFLQEIRSEYVGDYTITEELETGHKFLITLNIWDEKPEYEIEYVMGNDCISQEGNKYVCKYNGGSNLPSVIISYNDKKICELTPIELYKVSEVEKFNGEKFVELGQGNIVSDVGIYQYKFDIEDVLPDEYKNKFRLMDNTTIIIEIVE